SALVSPAPPPPASEISDAAPLGGTSTLHCPHPAPGGAEQRASIRPRAFSDRQSNCEPLRNKKNTAINPPRALPARALLETVPSAYAPLMPAAPLPMYTAHTPAARIAVRSHLKREFARPQVRMPWNRNPCGRVCIHYCKGWRRNRHWFFRAAACLAHGRREHGVRSPPASNPTW